MGPVCYTALASVPEVRESDDIASLIIEALAINRIDLRDLDILVLAQKIVSKAEGRYVDLRTVETSTEAARLAAICGKDERIVELVLQESSSVLRCVPGVIIVRHKLGLVLANAGIDQSNLPGGAGEQRVLLLPVDPDASARAIRQRLEALTGRHIGVAIIDSLGRAWRIGTCGTCIGASGLETVRDMRGKSDLHGRTLQSTLIGLGDELAAGASLVMGQAAEGTPIILVRGLAIQSGEGTARQLIRPTREDLFP